MMVRGTRWAVVVAVLSGSLVLWSSGAAEAATQYGAVSRAKVVACSGGSCVGSAPLPGPLPDVMPSGAALSCQVSAQQGLEGTASFVRFNADCERNAVLTLDDVSTPGGFDTSVRFTGTDSEGSVCGYSEDFGGIDSGTVTTDSVSGSSCAVNQVCVSWVLHSFWSELTGEGCTSMALDQPEGEVVTPGTCSIGTFSRPEWANLGTMGYPPETVWQARSVITPGEFYMPGYTMIAYFIHSTGMVSGGTPWYTGGPRYLNAGSFIGPTGEGPQINEANKGTIVGVGMYGVPAGDPVEVPKLPQNQGAGERGMVGVTDPDSCAFYWGDKVAAVTGDDTDEPLGGFTASGEEPGDEPADLTPPAADDSVGDEGCGFSLTDPGSWASAGVCELVGLFRELLGAVNAVGRAVARLAGQLLDGLVSLFVPDSAPSFSDIPNPLPAGWLPDFPSVSDGACGDLTLGSIDLGPMGGGATGPIHLVDTCADPWPAARQLVYHGLLALVLVGAAARAYGAVARSLGIDVDRPTGGGDGE